MSAPCWQQRAEVEGLDAASASQPDDCDHAAAGHDAPDWDTDAYAGASCAWDWLYALCALPAGHDGTHAYLSPNRVVLTFPEVVR